MVNQLEESQTPAKEYWDATQKIIKRKKPTLPKSSFESNYNIKHANDPMSADEVISEKKEKW